MVSVKAARNQILPPCVGWWSETDNQATTPFSYCPCTAFLHVQPHCPNARWYRCQDLNSFPFAGLEKTNRTPSYYVDEDYPAGPEIQRLPEWSNWCGSVSSTLKTDVHVWCYTLLVVHARHEWMIATWWMTGLTYMCVSVLMTTVWSDTYIVCTISGCIFSMSST